MKPVECEWEAEVLSAVLQSRWPERADAGLRAHAASCAICSDVAAIAGAIEADRDAIRDEAVLPDSGRVWWRAQLRARRAAAQAAGRPITAIQVMAFACATGLAGACFGATSEWFQAALQRFAAVMQGFPGQPLLAEHWVVALVVAAVLLVVPAAVFVAIFRD